MTVSAYKQYVKFFKKHEVVKTPEESKTEEVEQRHYKKSSKPSPVPLPADPQSVSQKLKDLAKLRNMRLSSNAVENIENSQSENLQNKKRTF
jgi:hypothetical protein